MTLRVCGFSECGVTFDAKTHNQKYHSSECCRLATNARIMENYYEKKARRQGFKRICKNVGCNTKLSRYNDKDICQKCEAAESAANRADLIRMFT